MRIRVLLAPILIAAGVVASCATPSKLVGSWQSDAYSQRSLRKVLCIAETPDIRIRQMAENEFVRQFQERKIQALPSYEILGTQTEITRANVEKAIRDTDIDAVFTIRVADEKSVRRGTRCRVRSICWRAISMMPVRPISCGPPRRRPRIPGRPKKPCRR